jgi:hypothetical protein
MAYVCGLLTSLSAFAQTDSYYQSHHWQLHTDAVSQSTMVAFYDNHNRIIYQETLPGKHIRLTPKNVRQLDETATRLATKQLVASVVQPDWLTPGATYFQPESGAERFSLLGTSVPDSAFAGFRSTVVPTPGDKVAVYYTLTNDDPVSILLLDPSENPVYQETSNHLKYKRYLDLENLGYGVYQLILSNSQFRYSYRLGVHYPSSKGRPVLLSAYGEPMHKMPVLEPLNVFLNQQKPDRNQRRKRLRKEDLFISGNRPVNPGNGDTGQKKERDIVLPYRITDQQ